MFRTSIIKGFKPRQEPAGADVLAIAKNVRQEKSVVRHSKLLGTNIWLLFISLIRQVFLLRIPEEILKISFMIDVERCERDIGMTQC